VVLDARPSPTGAHAAADAAVIVGIEDYAFLPDVPYAKRDAQAFADFLLYTRGIPSSHIARVATANREKILHAAHTAAEQAGAEGTVWLYFAGHGGASPTTGERMLMGIDVQPDLDTFAARSVGLAELQDVVTGAGASAVFVLDTCYTGQGRSGGELLAGKRFAVPAYAAAARPEVVEWSAASANQFSGPLPAARHGAFTYAVLGALRGWADGQLDGRRDGRITAEEARLYVEEALRSLQVRDQVPVLTGPSDRLLADHPGMEPPPELGGTTTAAGASPVGSPGGRFDGVTDVAAQLRAAEELKARLEVELATCLDEQEAERRAAATADWDKLAELRAMDGDEARRTTRPLVERYVGAYDKATVTCRNDLGEGERVVAIDEVAEARQWLGDSGPLGRVWKGASGYEMVQVPPGTFRMGLPKDLPGYNSFQRPHEVTITTGMWVGRYEVSQAVREAVTGERHDDGPRGRPASFGWCEAVAFANAMSRHDGLAAADGGVDGCSANAGRNVTWDRGADGYRLPTDAEWEYFARAGGQHLRYPGVERIEELCTVANIAPRWAPCDDGFDGLAAVGSLGPNAWGLHDVVGNARETCWDWHAGDRHTDGSAVSDPVADGTSATMRVHRGGSWSSEEYLTNLTFRASSSSGAGLRLVRTATD